MPLGKGHRPRVKPCIYDLFGSSHRAAALRACETCLIYIRPVELKSFGKLDSPFLKLFDAAYAMGFATLFAYPNGKGRAPITFSADCPINHVFQEVSHASVLDILRVPRNSTIIA